MSRIKVISHTVSTERLKDIYDELIDNCGTIGENHTIQSMRLRMLCKTKLHLFATVAATDKKQFNHNSLDLNQ